MTSPLSLSGSSTWTGTSFVQRPYRELSESLAKAFIPEEDVELQRQWRLFSITAEVATRAFFHSWTAPLRDYWFAENSADPRVCSDTLTLLYKLLQAAQYEVLEPNVFLDASKTDFQIAFPVLCQWNALDPTLFPRWYTEMGVYAAGCPSFAKRLMIFTRGVDIERYEGYFIFEKIDIILHDSWEKLVKAFGWSCKSRHELHDEELQLHSPTSRLSSSGSAFPGLQQDDGAAASSSLEQQRVTLRGFMKERGYLRSLWAWVELSEPLFNRVIIVYRPSSTAQASGRLQLHIREFTQIPFADLEALYPFRKILLPPLDTIKFAVQIVLLLWFLIAGLGEYEEIDTFGALTFFALLSGAIVARIVSLVYGYLAYVSYYENVLDSWLDKKKESRDAAAATKLCDDVGAQESKEIMLAYFFLWKFGSMKPSDLGRHVDQFLSVRMKLVGVTFDVEDALRKLTLLRLCRRTEPISSDEMYSDEMYECCGPLEDWCKHVDVQPILDLKLSR